VFSDLTPCSLAEEYQRFLIHFWCVHHQCRWPCRQRPHQPQLHRSTGASLHGTSRKAFPTEPKWRHCYRNVAICPISSTDGGESPEWMTWEIFAPKGQEVEGLTTKGCAICNIHRCHGMGMWHACMILTGKAKRKELAGKTSAQAVR